MMKNLIDHFSTKNTAQTQPIPGSAQVKNSAGGFSWAVNDWTRLDRFLILGTEGGSYHASARTLTQENAGAVLNCLIEDGPRTVARIEEISTSGRAPKNDAAIFALAMALKLGNLNTRRAARLAVPKVCRIGTHVFALAEAVQAFGGWGRITQGAFADWYTQRDPADLAYQAIKYQARNGWTGRDLLRKAHVKPPTEAHDAVLRWIAKGWTGPLEHVPDDAMSRIWAFEKAKKATTTSEIVSLIEDHGLMREAIPTMWLKERDVWAALLDNGGRGMPVHAMLRNLAKMTAIGLIQPMSDALRKVVGKIGNAKVLQSARVHPLAVLNALTTYQRGKGVRGSLTWRPVPQLTDALDGAFYTAFDAVKPTGKRWMLGLDVSGSMACGTLSGMPALTPRVGAAAMAMLTMRTEADYAVLAFQNHLVKLDLSPRMRLDAVLRKTSGLPFGATDCAQPMLYALRRKIPVDVFVIYTDSETWSGKVHPTQALQAYRDKMGIPAKLVVVGMVSNQFSIADPDDAGMLDIVGFDTAAPTVLTDFAR